MRRGLPIAVAGGRAWLASHWSLASIDLVGATLLLIKCPLEGFRHLCWLGPPVMKMPALWLKSASLAGCRSDPWDISQQMALP
jgi:hypothetical protein